jgi:hypothetical protein
VGRRIGLDLSGIPKIAVTRHQFRPIARNENVKSGLSGSPGGIGGSFEHPAETRARRSQPDRLGQVFCEKATWHERSAEVPTVRIGYHGSGEAIGRDNEMQRVLSVNVWRIVMKKPTFSDSDCDMTSSTEPRCTPASRQRACKSPR